MFANIRTRKIMGMICGLLAAMLLVSFSAAGQAGQPDDEEEVLYGAYAPLVKRDATYQESIGVLDLGFSADGWLLTNFSGSIDYGYAVAIQSDGKIVIAGSYDGPSLNFGLARFNPDGSLDTSFDEDGRVVTDFFGSYDNAYAIALQPDHKILVAGSAYKNSTDHDFALARYNPDGSLDDSFGIDGRVTTDFNDSADRAYAIVIQPNNQIVVAGSAYIDIDMRYDFALARYNEDGGLDTSFGVGGKVTTDFFDNSDYVTSLVLSGDMLVVAGYAKVGSYDDFALARYNSNGDLDPTFGAGGKVTTDISSNKDQGQALLQQADGRLVLAGWTYQSGNYNFALARYNTDGSLDISFDDDGKVVTDFAGGADYGYGITLDSENNLIVAGDTFIEGEYNFALARYDTNGDLDPTFDDDGMVTTDFYGLSDRGHAIARQEDGKLILAGYVTTVAGTDLALARYDANGDLDTSFDEDGRVVTNLFGSSDQGQAITMQPDGKLVLAGYVEGSTGTDFGVARYYSNGSPDSSFDFDGRLATDINGNFDYAYAVVVQEDGKIVVAGTASNGMDDDFALVRYNPDGSLDPTFNDDGIVISDYDASDDQINAILVQEDGKLVVAGQSETGSGLNFALARYNVDGSLDSSFGTNGWVMTDFLGDDDSAHALVQLDDKLIVAGYVYDGKAYDFGVARYDANGSLDPTFSGDGKVTTDINGDDDFGRGVALQADGKIIVVGWAHNGSNDDIALARYLTTGSLDPTFDGDGRVISDISGSDDRATAVAVQPNDKIMVGGTSYTANSYDFALARYDNGSLDTSFSGDGWLVTDFYGGDDSGWALLIQPGGQIILAGSADNGTDFDFAIVRYR